MGIVSIKSISPVAQLGLWCMSEPWQQLLGMLALPASEMEKLQAIPKEKRRQEWLACRVLLKEMVGDNALIGYDAERKPHLSGHDQQISMSHSGEYVCVYLSERKPVGVDIQQMKPSISQGSFYFLNEDEMQWADLKDNVQMHLIWSAKESVFKYAGDASIDLKKHITIKPFSGNQNGHFEVNLQTNNRQQTVPIQFDTFEDYVLTWTL
ncbi:4'-phosphopantetheinyl transferase superfamily protein [Dyadobacter sp. CY261]|uniref:4'-phosphopantetheinyl transferase family protein n=1 Tax=Dyadobacter sp. CY261 TaxID=2907203 RepID=UPI001F3C8427|nr:4'-phosphopantetheinyl transferase superfamily protein [Dyadobacter sp. CY261]MCF0070853.1 4'-phosphopantetheinyl transferase superfamily protein [Dyadobacter sp. CY261]